MARKNVELLLLENVENLGIVGDIVRVKTGYARNYLVPMGLAEAPTEKRIESLKEKRAEAEAELARLRAAREQLLGKMVELEITLTRSCNDQGVLYGSVTQRDIADALQENGYDVSDRSVRLSQPIRRIGNYVVPIQFDKDLRTEIGVFVNPDRPLDEREEFDIDEEGNIVEKPAEPKQAAKQQDAQQKDESAAPSAS